LSFVKAIDLKWVCSTHSWSIESCRRVIWDVSLVMLLSWSGRMRMFRFWITVSIIGETTKLWTILTSNLWAHQNGPRWSPRWGRREDFPVTAAGRDWSCLHEWCSRFDPDVSPNIETGVSHFDPLGQIRECPFQPVSESRQQRIYCTNFPKIAARDQFCGKCRNWGILTKNYDRVTSSVRFKSMTVYFNE
jgi:hypothetical protein